MSEKRKTTILVLLLLSIAGLIIGGFWWAKGLPSRNSILKDSSSGNEELSETFNQIKDIPKGAFNYGGSTTWAPIRDKVDPEIQNEAPQFRLNYTDPVVGNPGSSSGIKMLLEGKLAFSQSSRPLTEEEYQKARGQGFTLKQTPVAIDAIAFAIHPGLEVPGISIAQLKDIYLGKIVNWNQLGGPDLPIVPYSRHPKEAGTVDFFLENVLGGEKFGENVVLVPDNAFGLSKVASVLGGIFYASAIQVVGQCNVKPLPVGRELDNLIPPYEEPFVDLSLCPQQLNQLNHRAFYNGDYPLTRRLFVIVKQNGREEELAGNAYAKLLLTVQGQKLIEETGFISLHSK